MIKHTCTYCKKEAWGKFLKFKKKEPWHTFCIKRQQNASKGYRMPGGVSQ